VKKKLLYAVLVLVVLVGGFLGMVSFKAAQKVTAPLPPIKADTSPEAVARGALVFHTMCESCHRGPNAERVSGSHMVELPAALGTFYSANITLDAETGIGKMPDEQIARLLRFGVNRNDQMAVMPSSAMSDEDIAAVIGFMRSGDPLFAPENKKMPPSELTLLGKVALFATGAFNVPDRPVSGIKTPDKANKVEYGRYLAHDVFDCAGCHSPGLDPKRGVGPEAFSGGFEFVDASGEKILSTNITFHPTGIGAWSQEEFGTALRDGLRPKGSGVLRLPMPRFRGMEEQQVEAIYAYLQSKPQLPTKPAK
jgi:mono/diheme cytochrome c family protein